MRSLSCIVIAVTLLVSACSGAGGDPFGHDTIAVLDDGDLVLVDVEAGEVVAVPEAGAANRNFPAWSPDGSQLAFTATSGQQFSVDVFDGQNVSSIPTVFPSFYNYWDPSSEVVGYLGDDRGSVGFGIADTEAGTTAVVDRAQPYFFSWADDGSEMVSHSELDLRVLDREGELTLSLNVSPAFQAPVWLSGGNEVLVALGAANGSRLVALDVQSGQEREFFRFDGVLSLVVDPSGERLAVVHRNRDDGGGVLQAVVQEPVPTGLFIVDLDSGEITTIDDHPLRLSPFWSPDGDRLLSLIVDAEDPRQFARWEVHDTEGQLVARTERMQPSSMVAQLLPFADQYAQSTTPWSADSQSFLFAGTVEGGTDVSGIYVHAGDGFGASERLTAGTYAVWSPR